MKLTKPNNPRRAQNNPLHVSIFPSYDPLTEALSPVRTPLQFSLLLSSTLDVFELRARTSGGASGSAGGGGAATGPVSGDLGLLHAVDERLAAYGFETNTGTRFVAVVDMRGRRLDAAAAAAAASQGLVDRERSRGAAAVGLRDGEMKPVCRVTLRALFALLMGLGHGSIFSLAVLEKV